jgi:hypothetical protein
VIIDYEDPDPENREINRLQFTNCNTCGKKRPFFVYQGSEGQVLLCEGCTQRIGMMLIEDLMRSHLKDKAAQP